MYGAKKMRGEVTTLILVVTVAIAAGILASVFSSSPDSPVEQLAEEVIHVETGENVDFSANRKQQQIKVHSANPSVDVTATNTKDLTVTAKSKNVAPNQNQTVKSAPRATLNNNTDYYK